MIYFSYSLYGSQDKYTKGMIENAKILKDVYPDACVQVYIADDVPKETVDILSEMPNVKLINVIRQPGIKNMFDRFKAIDEPDCDIMIVRDADSRPHERDLSCINDFLKSDKELHIIRDHPYHSMKIMGGLWAIRKTGLSESMSNMIDNWLLGHISFGYFLDQHFLDQKIYPLFISKMMVHASYNFHEPIDTLTPFKCELKNDLFCGQVHIYDSEGNELIEFSPYSIQRINRRVI